MVFKIIFTIPSSCSIKSTETRNIKNFLDYKNSEDVGMVQKAQKQERDVIMKH